MSRPNEKKKPWESTVANTVSSHGRGGRVFTNSFRILEVTSVAAVAYRVPFKGRREPALRFLVPVPALRVFGSPQIWLTTLELFVASRRRYATPSSPLCASGASRSF